MKKILLFLFVILLIGVGGYIYKQNLWQTSFVDRSTIKIGVILPLSGNNAALGEGALKAAQLAFNEMTKNTKYTYQMVVEDDQLKGAITANVITKMISSDQINAVITYFAGSGLVVSPFANRHKLIHLGSTWEDAVADGKYNFIQNPTREDVAAKMLDQMKFFPDAKNIAFLTEVRSGTEIAIAMMQEKFEGEGYHTSLNSINRGEKDFRLLIQKLKNQQTDLFVLNFIPPETDIIIRQMHEAGITNDKITGMSFEIVQYPEALEGVRFLTASNCTEEFAVKMGGEVTYQANIVYDLMRLLIQAYEENYKEGVIPSSDVIADYILSLEPYDCASVKCTVTPQGHIVSPPGVKEYQGGKFIVIHE